MRDYQPQKYKQTLCLIRDYNRLKEDYEDAILESHTAEGGIGGGAPGDPTGALASKIENMHDRLKAVEKAKKEIPEEYQAGVWQNIIYDARYPDDADRHTYGRWKARFVYHVARNMGWI